MYDLILRVEDVDHQGRLIEVRIGLALLLHRRQTALRCGGVRLLLRRFQLFLLQTVINFGRSGLFCL